MTSPHDRLKQARIAAGYKTATAAAEAIGVNTPTYVHHENGTSGLSRAGERYARFFRINLEWLLTGRGDMKERQPSLRIMGYVGAGAVVDPIANLADQMFPEDVDLPSSEDVEALIVKGDSQWPRFMDGEIILVARQPVQPDQLIDCYAMVQTLDGRDLIKIIRRSGRPDEWLLESHNAPPEITRLMMAREYRGTLSPGRRLTLPKPARSRPRGSAHGNRQYPTARQRARCPSSDRSALGDLMIRRRQAHELRLSSVTTP